MFDRPSSIKPGDKVSFDGFTWTVQAVFRDGFGTVHEGLPSEALIQRITDDGFMQAIAPIKYMRKL